MRTENLGVSPLKENGKLFTDAADQAQLLNNQARLQPTHSIYYRGILQQVSAKHQTKIEDISISEHGIRKLLRNL